MRLYRIEHAILLTMIEASREGFTKSYIDDSKIETRLTSIYRICY